LGSRQEWLDGIIFDITEHRRFEQTARRAEVEAAVARELAEARSATLPCPAEPGSTGPGDRELGRASRRPASWPRPRPRASVSGQGDAHRPVDEAGWTL